MCRGVGIATGYRPDNPGSSPGRIVLFSTESRPALGPNPASCPMVQRAPSLGVKLQGREADHSSPSSVEVKNSGTKSPLPHTSSWCGAYLIKHRDSFTFKCVLSCDLGSNVDVLNTNFRHIGP
jgi:hypothetical protein